MVQMNLRRGSKSSLEESSEIILYEIILYTKGTLMHDLVSKIFLTLENLSVFNDFFVCNLVFVLVNIALIFCKMKMILLPK